MIAQYLNASPALLWFICVVSVGVGLQYAPLAIVLLFVFDFGGYMEPG